MSREVVKVRNVGDGEAPWREAWDEFVNCHEGFWLHHLSCWYDILRSFAVSPIYLIATREKRITGVVPAYLTRSMFVKTGIYTLFGGVLAEDEPSEAALFDELDDVRSSLRAKYLQIRGNNSQNAKFRTKDVRSLDTLTLSEDPSVTWTVLNKKTRWAVRQAERRGMHAVWSVANDRLMNEFWNVYAGRMRILGTPVMTRKYFTKLSSVFHDKVQSVALYHHSTYVGGMLCIVHKDTVYNLYASVNPEAQKEYGNYLLYWQAIRTAGARQYVKFDLGPSVSGSGAQKFKRKWRGLESFRYSLDTEFRTGETVSDRSVYLGRIWSHMPLSVCNKIGPLMRRSIPFG